MPVRYSRLSLRAEIMTTRTNQPTDYAKFFPILTEPSGNRGKTRLGLALQGELPLFPLPPFLFLLRIGLRCNDALTVE